MNFWRTLSLVGIVTILTLLMGCVSKVSSIKLDQDALSDPNEGYLLLGINSDVSLTSIEISGPKNIKLTSADLREGSRYILVDLPKGRYNIEQVRQDTWRGYLRVGLKEEYWSFDIEPGKISYVGELNVRKNRFGYISRFILVNRSSYALEYMQKEFKNILDTRIMVYSGPGEDLFLERLARQNFQRLGDVSNDQQVQQEVQP